MTVPPNTRVPRVSPCPGVNNKEKKPSTGMDTSEAGVDFIATKEGFRGTMYDDIAGHCTIGYGHLVHRGQCDGRHPAEDPFRNGVTETEGRRLLGQKIDEFEIAVRRLDIELRQTEFDALVSFTYNLGIGVIGGKSFEARLKSYSTSSLNGEVLEFLSMFSYASGRWSQGLNNRRVAEALGYAGFCEVR